MSTVSDAGEAEASLTGMRTRPRLRAAALSVRRDAFNRDRLVLAAKTAVAATVAWWLAPWVPFADADYSYYAPLGVLVSMHPTLVDSLRSSAQAVLGIALGITWGLVGLLLEANGLPGLAVLAIVVAASVAMGGIRALGAGSDWIAIAALFVLLLGATDPDGFTSSYLLTMAFGTLVGLATNLVVLPPLYLNRAAERLTELRDVTAAALDRIAARVKGGDGGDEPEADLTPLLDAVTEDVQEAERSRRGNPMGWRRRGQDENVRRLRALDDTVRSTIHLADLAAELSRGEPRHRLLLAEAIAAVSRLVATPVGAEEAGDRLRDADRTIAAYLDDRSGDVERMLVKAHAVAYLSRIADASRPLT